MTERFEQLYMDIAQRMAEMSRARRLKVGAVIVRDDRILSMGYNGTPAGWDNNCEHEQTQESSIYDNLHSMADQGWQFIHSDQGNHWLKLTTRAEVLHAESNAISKLARSTESGEGATMFCTHTPCMECAKLIYQSGINRVYFGRKYRSTDGIDFLTRCGVEVKQVVTAIPQL
jgi:dCMP deaminase